MPLYLARRRHSNHSSADALADHRFARDIAALNRLGDRVAYETWAQVGRERGCRQYLEDLVRRFVERLSPELLAVTGGDRLPPVPIHRINFTRGDDDP